MIVRLYIKQPLLNDICKNKSIMVIYMCFVYTKDFRGIVIGKFLFMESGIFLKSRRNDIRINPVIGGNITEGFAFYKRSTISCFKRCVRC